MEMFEKEIPKICCEHIEINTDKMKFGLNSVVHVQVAVNWIWNEVYHYIIPDQCSVTCRNLNTLG